MMRTPYELGDVNQLRLFHARIRVPITVPACPQTRSTPFLLRVPSIREDVLGLF
jgi:hypothetical protein